MTQSMYRVLAFVGAVVIGGDAQAGSQVCCSATGYVKWPSSNVVLNRSPISFPNGSSAATRLTEVAARFAAVSGSTANISVVLDDDNVVGHVSAPGGENDVWITEFGPDETTLAETFLYWDSGNCGGGPCCLTSPCAAPAIVEADIIFYNKKKSGGGWSWNYAQPTNIIDATQFTSHYFSLIALHELGHALGLTHDADGMSSMDPRFPVGGWSTEMESSTERADVWAHSVIDLSLLYPGGPSNVDLYVPSMFHDPSPPPGYASGRVLSARAGAIDLDYYPRRLPVLGPNIPHNARVGDALDVRVCWGNRGTINQTTLAIFDIAFSSNAVLEVSDPRVGNNTWSVSSVPAGHANCQVIQVNVPNVSTGAWNIIYSFGGAGGNNFGIVNRKVNVIL